jgi:hypothetical protein
VGRMPFAAIARSLGCAGGSAIGLSATDAYGQSLWPVMHRYAPNPE